MRIYFGVATQSTRNLPQVVQIISALEAAGHIVQRYGAVEPFKRLGSREGEAWNSCQLLAECDVMVAFLEELSETERIHTIWEMGCAYPQQIRVIIFSPTAAVSDFLRQAADCVVKSIEKLLVVAELLKTTFSSNLDDSAYAEILQQVRSMSE